MQSLGSGIEAASRYNSDLLAFSTAGNGVIVGQPGVGKSYALADLREQLKANGIPHLILRAGAKSAEFSQITSEVQLLEMYWEYRIRRAADSADREFILEKATRAMVEDHTLTVRRNRVYRPDVRKAWDGKQLRESLEKEGKLPPNTPLVSVSSSWSRVTEGEIFRHQGASPESPANAEIRELYRPLKEWCEKNKDEAQIDGLMPAACAVREFLTKESGADAVVLRAASAHLASFASGALLGTSDSIAQRFQTLREMVLSAASHPDPEPDPEHDPKWNSAA